jgi:acetylornithine/succinyldiaminopimelate/putrescine aminotransferase
MGGNALTAAAALAYVSELIEGDWPARAADAGKRLMDLLRREIGSSLLVRELRGRGLMIGIELNKPAAAVQLACERAGLLVGLAGPNVVRLLPPLNVRDEDAGQAVATLARALREQEG